MIKSNVGNAKDPNRYTVTDVIKNINYCFAQRSMKRQLAISQKGRFIGQLSCELVVIRHTKRGDRGKNERRNRPFKYISLAKIQEWADKWQMQINLTKTLQMTVT